MKIFMGLILVGILAAAGASALHLEIADGPVAAVFPQNQVQRAALSQCEQQSPKFDRLDQAARETCYHDSSTTSAQPSLPANTAQAPNQLDLREAAARGNLQGYAAPQPAHFSPFHR
jgi:hypothetical protein